MIIWKINNLKNKKSSIFLIQNINLIKNINTFEQIPGPNGLPIIGNLWRYLPLIGNCNLEKIHEDAFRNYNQFGSLVREHIFGRHSVLHVFDPDDMKTVLKNVDKNPIRRSHRALLKYRLDRPDLYNSGGLFPENGEVWYNLRKNFHKVFMNAKNIRQYVKSCDQITNELFDYINKNIQENFKIKHDFYEILFKWSLENTAFLALDIKLNILNTNLNEELKLLIASAHNTHSAVAETESSSDLWKIYKTKSYRKLENAQDNMFRILKKYFDKRMETLDEKDELQKKKIFNQLILNKNLDRKDIFMFLIDLFLAAIDTTSFSCSFALYFLALNPSKQEKLRIEVSSLLNKTNGVFKEEHLDQLPYLKACFKETMRLQPVSIGIGRVSDKEFILRNYLIPKDTMIILHNQIACKLEKNFKACQQFIPERWLKIKNSFASSCEGNINEDWLNSNSRESKNKKNELNSNEFTTKINPFLVLPFGFGSRVCLGRAYSEMEVYVLLAKLIYNYQVSYDGQPIQTFTRLINVPDKPMLFKFKKLN